MWTYKQTSEESPRAGGFRGAHTFMGFNPGTTPGSHSEEPTKIPLWFWLQEGKSNNCEICTKCTLSKDRPSGVKILTELYPTWGKGISPTLAPASKK